MATSESTSATELTRLPAVKPGGQGIAVSVTPDTERQLVASASRGDHHAFTRLLEIYDRRVMGVIMRFTGNRCDREDLYQDVFTACYQALPRFDGRCAFYTWLHRIALNQCLKFVRDHKRYEPQQEVAVDGPDRDCEAQLLAVINAQKKLSGPQRIAFHLFYVEQWHVEEIAELLDCNINTVKTHLHRAREKVRADEGVSKWNIAI